MEITGFISISMTPNPSDSRRIHLSIYFTPGDWIDRRTSRPVLPLSHHVT